MSYTVKDVIDRIRFYTATENDLIGKSANELFSNKNILAQNKNFCNISKEQKSDGN